MASRWNGCACRPGGSVSAFRIPEKMVVISRSAGARLALNEAGDITVDLGAWDTFSVPVGVWRSLTNTTGQPVELIVITQGDNRKRPEFAAGIIARAKAGGLALHAGGFAVKAHLLPQCRFVG